jgi:protein-S-isoprenylcysteine O-methyltransferase Ste14
MNTASKVPSTSGRSDLTTGILMRALALAISFIVLAVVLFVGAGRLNWTWAWVYLSIYLATILINSTIMLRTNPETIAERGRPKESKDWDKVVSGLWGLVEYLLLPLAAALDVRFGWTREFGVAWHIAGIVVVAVGLGLGSWAMLVNAYFSTVVRIQSERGHTVCRSGPYRYVRHPGYLGFSLQSLGIALLLGSWWALIPGIAAAAIMTIRTFLEDRMLQAELPGYVEYANQVRYRLLPGIW